MQHTIARKFAVAFFLIGLALVLRAYGGINPLDEGKDNAPSGLHQKENPPSHKQILPPANSPATLSPPLRLAHRE